MRSEKEDTYGLMWLQLRSFFNDLKKMENVKIIAESYIKIMVAFKEKYTSCIDMWANLKHHNSVILHDEKAKSLHNIVKTIIDCMNAIEKDNGIKRAK